MIRLFWAILRLILGPKLTAGLQGAQAAYEAEDQKEQAAALHRRAAEMYTITEEAAAKTEQAHEEVASAGDPDAVVNEQLRELGLVADKRSAGGVACATNTPAPARRKTESG